MSEFDEKLNTLLSNPKSVEQIMQLAKTLSANQNNTSSGSQNAPPNTGPAAQPPPPKGGPPVPPGPEKNFFSSMDPKLFSKLMPLIQELNGPQDSNARRLLYALQPYLKPERQDKVERALQLAKLIHIGKKFISSWGG